jgi:hypothetical protein
MSAFTVELDNHPGELARLCEAMASSSVNLLLCATTHGNSVPSRSSLTTGLPPRRCWTGQASSTCCGPR